MKYIINATSPKKDSMQKAFHANISILIKKFNIGSLNIFFIFLTPIRLITGSWLQYTTVTIKNKVNNFFICIKNNVKSVVKRSYYVI